MPDILIIITQSSEPIEDFGVTSLYMSRIPRFSMEIEANLLFVKKKVDSSVWRRSWATGTVAAVFRSVFGVSFDL